MGRCFNLGWEAFKANPVTAIVGFLAASLISSVPCVNIFIAAPLTGGMAILALNLVNRNRPEIGDIFKGFEKYLHFMGVFWLLIAIVIVAYIPTAIGSLLGAAIGVRALASFLSLVGFLVTVVLIIGAMTRLGFALFIVAENLHEGSVMTAFKKSVEITERNYVNIFVTLLVAYLIGAAGTLACFIGMFVTVPIAWCMFAALYNDLKPQSPAVARAEEPAPEPEAA